MSKRAIASSSSSVDDVTAKRARDTPSTASSDGTEALIPPNLLAILHPHQRQAVDFLLHRLLPNQLSNSSDIGHSQRLLQTGAILADDMGTGKTLVGISTMWTICRALTCKGVIITPSTLTKNWDLEMKKWLPGTLGRTAIVLACNTGKSTQAMDIAVNKFITSHPTVHPVLIVSYEMFRIYAEALNTMRDLEVVLCDEGHRLKNALGTKTTVALGNCCAMRRIVLTGTPIQNNLDELYAVVQFVIPNFLDTLQDFRRDFIQPMERGKKADASKAERQLAKQQEEALAHKLSSIILRRTKDSVMRDLLPKKHEVVISTALTASQRDKYAQECQEIVNSLGSSVSSVKAGSLPLTILPKLLSLRLICSKGDANMTSSATTTPSTTDEATAVTEPTMSLDEYLPTCAKFQTCCDLIGKLRETHPEEKLIIVSNFISSLDAMKYLCKLKQWNCLRIDGSVANDRRMRIVQYFNKAVAPKQPTESVEEVQKRNTYFILLLSAKAGGVGLNLIGANRLIMLEPDWNPATDQQAMARIYREGQKKEIFIYRLINQQTIEEVILQRQYLKARLSAVVRENQVLPPTSTEEIGEDALCEDDVQEKEEELLDDIFTTDLMKSGIQSILYPSADILEQHLTRRKSSDAITANDNCLQAVLSHSSTTGQIKLYTSP